MKKTRLAITLFSAWLFIFLMTAPITKAEKLLVGYAGVSADLSHLWIANEAGLFKKYGIDLVPVYMGFIDGLSLWQGRRLLPSRRVHGTPLLYQ
jgi:hypothetical protein